MRRGLYWCRSMLIRFKQKYLLRRVWILLSARALKHPTSVGFTVHGRRAITTYFDSLINAAHLFSVETQDITPGTSPGSSQIGTEVPKPPAYETLDAAVGSLKLRVRRLKLYHKEDSQNVETVGFWRNTPS